MAFRLLQYMMRIWEDLRRREPERSQLPAILPVVLHHSSTGWTAATELLDLFDLTSPPDTSPPSLPPRPTLTAAQEAACQTGF